jgi:molybdopterin/thiamine biosynthesis adenylyltransferase
MRTEYSIRISERDFKKCKQLVMAKYPKESAAFLLVGKKNIGNAEELLVRRIVEIPASEYRVQEHYHLHISPRAINGLVSLCEQNGLGVILCHSHPTDSPYSPSDNKGERRIAETLWDFLPKMPVGSLLISPNKIDARIWEITGHSHSISYITIIGRCIRKIYLNDLNESSYSFRQDIFNRQILAFDKQGQQIISNIKVGIVGLGGTGSPTAEQLARLGVSDIVLIDPDYISPSNITRVYGSYYSDIKDKWPRWLSFLNKKRAKVYLIARNIRRIKPDAKVITIKASVVNKTALQSLLDRDVIFCCTDEHWGRSVVNQLSYQYLIPVINMGIRIDAKDSTVQGAFGSVDIIRHDKPCLWCSGFLNGDRIMAESLPEHERRIRLRDGYVQNIGTNAPSVISLTTTISGHAVTAFLQLITDFFGETGDFTRLNYFIMESEVSRGIIKTDPGCICAQVKGYGDLKSLPAIK